jgi:tetratricopeptide (TPR) repeat protein
MANVTDKSKFARLTELAWGNMQQGNYQEAETMLLRAYEYRVEIHKTPILDWILTALSTVWDETEQYDKRTKILSEFISQNPDSGLAYTLRGGSYWYSGSLAEALQDYSHALRIDPNDASALVGRGQVFAELRRFREALEDLNAALDRFQAVPDATAEWKSMFEAYARNGRAFAYAGLGDFSAALQEFANSIKLQPENAWVYFNLAEAFRSNGEKNKAVENYKLALAKKNPKLTPRQRKSAEISLADLRA